MAGAGLVVVAEKLIEEVEIGEEVVELAVGVVQAISPLNTIML